MKQAALVLAVLAFASPVHAVISKAGPTVSRTGSGLVIQYPDTGGSPIAASARTITAVGNAARVIDLVPIQGPAGNLPVTVTRTVSASAVAAGLARVAVKAVPAIALTSAALDLLKGAGVRIGPNGVELDNGVESTLVDDLSYQVSNGPIAGTMAQACSAYAQAFNSLTSGYRGDNIVWEPYGIDPVVVSQGSGYLCKVYLVDPFNGSRTLHRNEPVVTYKTQKQSCGTGIARLDGLCETGVYYPATESQVLSALDRLSQKVDASVSLRALIDSGGYADSSPLSITGPSSQVGDSITTNTTGPSGQVSTTVTPTYNYTYNGDTVTYNIVNNTVTNKTDIDGKTTTETTTTVKPPDKGMCDLYPDSLACMKPGDPPTDPAPTPKSVPISIEPMAFPGQGACPPPITFSVFGASYAFEWTPFCDVLTTWVRPLVLVMSIAAAAMIFVGGLKS